MATASTSTADLSNGDETRLRAASASADWLSLIDPVHQTITGTNGNDTLAAGADGDIVEGLRGDDDLSSTFNRTALIGNQGNDTLTTDVFVPRQGNDPVHGVAVQFGGADDDTMNATMTLEGGDVTVQQRELTADVRADGGIGNDDITVTANVASAIFGDATLETHVLGGDGKDTIVATADAENVLNENRVMNTVDGGADDDTITALARTEFDGSIGTAINVVDGGEGNDVMTATAIGHSNATQLVQNSMHGGRGDDLMSASNLTNSNSRAPVGINELWGEDGNDTLQADHTATGNRISDVTNHLDGGKGTDNLSATVSANGEFVRAVNDLDGGNQNDILVASMDIVSFGFGGPPPSFPNAKAYDISNILSGGFGDDSLQAYLSVQAMPGVTDGSKAENRLDGGGGNDTLVATVATDGVGTSFLNGGGGDDALTVIGGTDNHLDGGTGKDTLTSGSGDDTFFGGGGADAFVFAPPNGHDTIGDFETGRDLIDLTAFAAADIHDFSDLTIDATSGDSVIQFDVGNDITVAGVTQLRASDFLFA
jgi:serralysin